MTNDDRSGAYEIRDELNEVYVRLNRQAGLINDLQADILTLRTQLVSIQNTLSQFERLGG